MNKLNLKYNSNRFEINYVSSAFVYLKTYFIFVPTEISKIHDRINWYHIKHSIFFDPIKRKRVV